MRPENLTSISTRLSRTDENDDISLEDDDESCDSDYGSDFDSSGSAFVDDDAV